VPENHVSITASSADIPSVRATFIRPGTTPGAREDFLEPLVFAILFALTPPDVNHVLCDERIETNPFDEAADLASLAVAPIHQACLSDC
jgi:hypothetical protein